MAVWCVIQPVASAAWMQKYIYKTSIWHCSFLQSSQIKWGLQTHCLSSTPLVGPVSHVTGSGCQRRRRGMLSNERVNVREAHRIRLCRERPRTLQGGYRCQHGCQLAAVFTAAKAAAQPECEFLKRNCQLPEGPDHVQVAWLEQVTISNKSLYKVLNKL